MELDITKLMEQAKTLQSQFENTQKKLESIVSTGSAGADMVSVTVNGLHKLLSVHISDELLQPNNKKMLEDLIVAAVNNAIKNAAETSKTEVEKITGGFPGFPNFANFA
ncbi:MAG: YbaB/EbfC family nucleoid-associated protein [Ignavibacteria bacterium]|jgi:DNA-binding YbaB/EbfC family protein|nr:YbaB/EbfC family nucleoid-associated protein [Ignavibacteria bacterium]